METENQPGHTVLAAAMPSAALDQWAALLRVMNEELERLRKSDVILKEGTQRADADQKRLLTLLAMCHDEMITTRQINSKLHRDVVELGNAHRELSDAHETVKGLLGQRERDLQVALLRIQEAEQSAKLKDAEHKVGAEDAEKRIGNISTRLEKVTSEFEKAKLEFEHIQRLTLENRVHLETRLHSRDKDNEDLQVLRQREVKEAFAREYQLSRHVKELKESHETAAHAAEAERMKLFEQVTLLRSELEQKSHQLSLLQTSSREREHQLTAQLQKTKVEGGRLREELESLRAASAAQAKAQEHTVQKLCTDLRQAQSENNTLHSKVSEHERERVETVVSLHVKNDAQKSHISLLEDRAASLDERLRMATMEHGTERDKLRSDHAAMHKDFTRKLEEEKQAQMRLDNELHVATRTVAALEMELASTKESTQRACQIHALELSACKAEVEGYKLAVAKLEGHISDQFEPKLAQEQNEQLQQKVRELQNRLLAANTQLADWRIEADISANYKLTLIQEQSELQAKQIAVLHKERTAAAALIERLRQSADPSMEQDVANFQKAFWQGRR